MFLANFKQRHGGKRSVEIRDAGTYEVINVINIIDTADQFCFSRNEQFLAVSVRSKGAFIYETATASEFMHVKEWRCTCVCFNNICTQLFVRMGCVGINVYDFSTKELLQFIPTPHHVGEFNKFMTVSLDDTLLAYVHETIRSVGLRIVDVATGEEVRQFGDASQCMGGMDVDFTSGSSLVAGATTSRLTIWDMMSGEERQVIGRPQKGKFGKLKFFPDGERLAVKVFSLGIQIYNHITGVPTVLIADTSFRSLSINVTGTQLACVYLFTGPRNTNENCSLRIYDTSTAEVVRSVDCDADEYMVNEPFVIYSRPDMVLLM